MKSEMKVKWKHRPCPTVQVETSAGTSSACMSLRGICSWGSDIHPLPPVMTSESTVTIPPLMDLSTSWKGVFHLNGTCLNFNPTHLRWNTSHTALRGNNWQPICRSAPSWTALWPEKALWTICDHHMRVSLLSSVTQGRILICTDFYKYHSYCLSIYSLTFLVHDVSKTHKEQPRGHCRRVLLSINADIQEPFTRRSSEMLLPWTTDALSCSDKRDIRWWKNSFVRACVFVCGVLRV